MDATPNISAAPTLVGNDDGPTVERHGDEVTWTVGENEIVVRATTAVLAPLRRRTTPSR